MKRYLWMIAAYFTASCLAVTGCGAAPMVSSSPSPAITAGASPTQAPSPSPTSAPTQEPTEPWDEAFVRVTDYIPNITVELRYATDNNFTGKVIYDFTDAWLRYGTVKKLMEAENELEKHGFRLKLWDAFRPVSAQFTLWETVPDSRYVANPNKGYSNHSRGDTVAVTLTDEEGNEAEMPTGFDDFTAKADRDYSDVTETAAENAKLLEETMTDCGFKPSTTEWWHYSDTDDYAVAEDFDPGTGA